MKSKTSFLMILILPFFFVGDDANETAVPEVDLSKQNFFEGDILLSEEESLDEIKRSAVLDKQIWPNKKIPYVISQSYTQSELNLILDAMKAFKINTCVEFIPRTTENDYIDIQKFGYGCSSYVGKIGGRQAVSLDNYCLEPRHIILHELMHSLGFWHEQSRPDRDDYVTVYYENIDNGRDSFEKYDSETVQLLGTPYDISSVTHYQSTAFTLYPGKLTITDKKGNKIEKSPELTLMDILDVNRLYKCPNGTYIDWKEQKWDNASFLLGLDCDFQGTIIRQVWVFDHVIQVQSKREDCGPICASDATCNHFTWKPDGNCVLKTADKFSTKTSIGYKGAACGYITQGNYNFQWIEDNHGNKGKFNYGCDFSGTSFYQEDILLPHVCTQRCNREPQCTSYVVTFSEPGDDYAYDSGYAFTCYYKNGKSPIARVHAAATTSFTMCGMITERT